MPFIFLVIFLVFSGSSVIALLFKKDIEVTVPVWIMSIVLLLYLFGIFNLLMVGYYAIIILCIISCIGAAVLLVKRKESVLKIITPGTIILIAIVFIAYFGHNGRMFMQTDEFSHWGLAAKNLFQFDALVGGAKANLIFKDYPPATGLFQYIFLNLYGEYSEGIVYFAMNVLYFSMMMPMLNGLEYKKPLQAILRIIVIYILPITLFQDFFTSIYVDAVLGVLFAYILLSYFNGDDDLFSIINMSVVFSFLVLVKGAGLGLLIIALVIILANITYKYIIDMNCALKPKFFKRYRVAIIPFVSSLAFYISWKVYLLASGISRTWTSGDSGLLDMMINPSSTNVEIIKNFIQYHFSQQSYGLNFPISYFAWICIAVLAFIILIYCMDSKKAVKEMRMVLISMILCCYLYLGSVLIMYLTVFSTNEALRLASIDRYTNTYMIGWVLFIAGIVFSDKIHFVNKRRNLYMKVFAIVLCIFVNISPVLDITLFSSESIAHSELFRSYFNPYEDAVEKLDESDNVEVIHIESKGFEYSVYNYLTAPRRMHNSFSVGTEPYYEGDVWTKLFSISEYSDYLLDGRIDYVYVSYANDKFNDDFGELFDNNCAENCRLYEVNYDDSNQRVKLCIVD